MRVDIPLPPDLNGYVAGVAGTLEFGRQQVKNAIKDLTPEQMTQVPAGLSNSIATLVVHICATEISFAHWIAGTPVPDDLKREFLMQKTPEGLLAPATGETVASLNAKLDKSRELLMGVMGRLTQADLDRELQSSKDRQPTVRWAISMLPNHQAQHWGHLQMVRKLIK